MPTARSSRPLAVTSWVLQGILAAGLLLFGAFFKLTGDPSSEELFALIGSNTGLPAEPAGRYAVGIWELLAGILLLVPRTVVFGAIAAALGMLGAIGTHLFAGIGIMTELSVDPTVADSPTEPQPLFFIALLFFALSLAIVALRRDELPGVGGDAAPSGD